jgi:hypothetical protein
MARTTTEADTARALGVNQKTLQRWREKKGDRPAVPHSMVGGRPFYDVAEVRAWMLEHGVTGARPGSSPPAGAPQVAPLPIPPPVPGSVPPPDGGTQHAGAEARVLDARGKAQVSKAKAIEATRQAKVREGMASLGLAQRVRAGGGLDECEACSRELTALMAEGKVLPLEGRGIREALTEWRQALKLREKRDSAPTKDVDKALIVTAEAAPLVVAFEGITDAARRQRVLEFVRATAAEDRALGPRPDTGEPGQDVA